MTNQTNSGLERQIGPFSGPYLDNGPDRDQVTKLGLQCKHWLASILFQLDAVTSHVTLYHLEKVALHYRVNTTGLTQYVFVWKAHILFFINRKVLFTPRRLPQEACWEQEGDPATNTLRYTLTFTFQTDWYENIARVQNYPVVAKLNSLFGLSFVFLLFCLFFYIQVFLSFCLFVFLSFCLFVFLSRHHSDQMSQWSQVSKVTLCVKILKWHSLSQSVSDQGQV